MCGRTAAVVEVQSPTVPSRPFVVDKKSSCGLVVVS